MEVTRRGFLAAMGGAALMLAGCSQGGEGKQDSPVEPEPADLEVSESGYFVDEWGSAHWAAIVTNPNKTWAAEKIRVNIAARDADGNVIDSTMDSITLMFPDGETAVCGEMMPPDGLASIDVTVSVSSDDWSEEHDVTHDDLVSRLPVVGASEQSDGFGGTYVAGEVRNDTEGDWSGTRVFVVWRDGNGAPIGGTYTYIGGDLMEGSTSPFSTLPVEVPEHASFDVYVDCGYPASA